jgi:hypothetical protein
MKVIQDDLWLCLDCTIVAVNGDTSEMDEDRAAEVEAGLDRLGQHLVPDFDVDKGEGHEEFSQRTCDSCGSSLAGEHHRFAVLGEGDPAEEYQASVVDHLIGIGFGRSAAEALAGSHAAHVRAAWSTSTPARNEARDLKKLADAAEETSRVNAHGLTRNEWLERAGFAGTFKLAEEGRRSRTARAAWEIGEVPEGWRKRWVSRKVYIWEVSLMVTSPERPRLKTQRNYSVRAESDTGADAEARKRAALDNLTVIETVSAHRGYKVG